MTIFKGHKMKAETIEGGDWLLSVKGPLLNGEKTFSRLSIYNSTFEVWEKEITKLEEK